jgi:hypothetical protein
MNSAWQLCHADGCNTVPMNELGVPVETSVRKWFCPDHQHLAAPGDMEARGSGIRISEGGALVPIDEGDEARDAAEAESRRRLREERAAEREHDAAVAAAQERLREEAFRAELGPGVPG